jgi:hypothetical protein
MTKEVSNTMKNRTIFNQIKRNSVALISLFIAVSSLSYNTWRNELSEKNRNQRHAAFEILLKINELQQVVHFHYYDKDTTNKGNPRTAWAYVATIKDLASILNNPLPQSSQNLLDVWERNWQGLAENQENLEAIEKAIDNVRKDSMTLLQHLK